jgi:hypothetical protein
MREQTQLNENPTCAGVATEFPEQLPLITAGWRLKSKAYPDHWRRWRQQLATVANSEKRAPLQQISRLMKSIAFLITAAWR